MKNFNRYFNVDAFILLFIVLFILYMLSSCKSRETIVSKEVPIEKTKIEYREAIKYDSIYIHDSINIYSKGDTVFKDKVKLVYKEKLVRDSIEVHDTIDKPVYINTTQIEKVNELTKFQKILIIIGLSSCIFILTWLVLKFKKLIL